MKPIRIHLLTLTLLLSTPLLHAAPDVLLSESSVVGTVSGKDVLLSDIENQKINELRIQLHDALQEAFIQHAVGQLTSDSSAYQLPAPVVINDDQIESFYMKNNLQGRGSLEKLGPMIREYMEGMAKARGQIQLYQRATLQGDVTSRLVKPKEMLLKLSVDSAYIRGNDKAQVMVMEFSDFQCPFCKRAQATVKQLIEQYGDQVAFGYRHFPLAFHKEADDAAIAVECARDQGGFEAMHDILFSQPDNLSRTALKAVAKRVKLKDLEQFDNCLDKDTYADRVANDMAAGQSVGITGTPGFIVGFHNPDNGTLEGELISGAQPANVFVSAIEKYLKGR
ncbi:DsbA family protein [Sedimenticola sp.]|uniref:DsbA family protein n=1 Tax=Sedimenticola sp. TaxID=1940285 RepID=UPI003D0DEB29